MLYFFGCAAYGAPGNTPAQNRFLEDFFHTGWFVESLFTQTLIVHMIRTQRIPFIQSRPSRTMFLATISIMAIGAWLPFSRLASFFGFVRLPGIYFAWIAGFLLAYGALTHTVKTWFYRRFGTD